MHKHFNMSVLKILETRSGNCCELCAATENLAVYEVPQSPTAGAEAAILVCATCKGQLEDADSVQPDHWRCLNESMWSEHAPVQVTAYRMLHQLRGEGWPQDLLDMLYLDEETLAWARAGISAEGSENAIVHRDVNGAVLEAGDSVVLIKDLKVKGSSMVAKQGTAVRRISLDHENAEYIEGKVDGQQIVIITKYVKKI